MKLDNIVYLASNIILATDKEEPLISPLLIKEVAGLVVALGILIGVILAIWKHLGKNASNVDIEEEESIYIDFPFICKEFNKYCDDIEQYDYESSNLNKDEVLKRRKYQDEFKLHRKDAKTGSDKSRKFMLTEVTKFLSSTSSFTLEDVFSAWDIKDDEQPEEHKYFILAYMWEQTYGYKWLVKVLEDNNLLEPKYYEEDDQSAYEITEEDIDQLWNVYRSSVEELTETNMLQIVAQRVYQSTCGNGCIDQLIETDIDGVSIGISGVPSSAYEILKNKFGVYSGDWIYDVGFNSVWALIRGNQTNLRFLGFHSSREQVRVCKNLYQGENARQLTLARGYIANTRKDGSRVVVARSIFVNNWCAFIRKFGTGEEAKLSDLMEHANKEKVVQLSKWLTRAKTNHMISGGQGSGKSTWLRSLLREVPRQLTLRIYQLTSELHLRMSLKKQNVVEMFETEDISMQDGLIIGKKMDGNITVIGETADYNAFNALLQSCETGSDCGMTSLHTVTVPSLIDYATQAQVVGAGYSTIEAQKRAVKLLHFNTHLTKNLNGDRYIERISQIIPEATYAQIDPKEQALVDDMSLEQQYYHYSIKVHKKTLKDTFYTYNNLLEWIDGAYYFTNKFEDNKKQYILDRLTDKQKIQFLDFCEEMDREVDLGTAEKAREAEKAKLESLRGNAYAN